MSTKSLKIDGCWIFEPNRFSDERGYFFEWFQNNTFNNQTGEEFKLAQANCSVSQSGVIRGIHVAKNPPGQAKYVTCFTGSVFDVVVDLRKDSETFGQWDSIIISSQNPTALYIPSGIGHAFMALEDNTTFVYLCDQRYNPNNEFDLNPFDPVINIQWPNNVSPKLSAKDAAAMSFAEMIEKLRD